MIGKGRNTFAQSLADPNVRYQFEYQLIPLDRLITSHDDNLNINPEFPSKLQPRLRDRAASKLQIGKIANTLSPDALLADIQQLDRGPAIIGPDKVVESGNGRVMALRAARSSVPDRWALYQKALASRIDDYGFTAAELSKVKDPVLVRQRVTQLDRAKFAAEANQSAVLTMWPLEQALQDAKRISPNLVAGITVREGQSLEAALLSKDNRPLVTGFMQEIPANERAALIGSGGELNQAGIQRLKAALFTRTYPGDAGQRLTAAFFESIDPTIKTVEVGMFASLPAMSQAEELTRSGQRDSSLSISEDIAKAVDMLARLKDQRITVDDFLKQSTLFARELTTEQEALLKHFASTGRSSKRVSDFLNSYAEQVEASQPPNQGAFFGFTPPDKNTFIAKALADVGKPRETAQATLL